MLVLTGMSGMAHAAEVAEGSIAGIQFTVHSDGDGDEVSADADKDYPHHHTVCHGHDVGEPIQSAMPRTNPIAAIRPTGGPVVHLVGTGSLVALRPPQA